MLSTGALQMVCGAVLSGRYSWQTWKLTAPVEVRLEVQSHWAWTFLLLSHLTFPFIVTRWILWLHDSENTDSFLSFISFNGTFLSWHVTCLRAESVWVQGVSLCGVSLKASATGVEPSVRESRASSSQSSVSALPDKSTLCSSFFLRFNHSAMAYMVCCGPKIRRRKLNNVFLFFKGGATLGWL